MPGSRIQFLDRPARPDGGDRAQPAEAPAAAQNASPVNGNEIEEDLPF